MRPETRTWRDRLFSWPWRPWRRYNPPPTFKPCVLQNDELHMTEMVLEDTMIVWRPWGPKGHAVDLGYDADGNLVGIKVWDAVAKRA